MDTTSFDKTKTEIDGPMHTSLRHDSAHKHVTGSAEYIDDIPEPAGLVHGDWRWAYYLVLLAFFILLTFVSEKAFAALTRWASKGMAVGSAT